MHKNLWRVLFDRSNENGKKTSKKEGFFENFISTKGTYKKYREQTAINTNSPNKIHKNLWRVLLDKSNENGKDE